MSFVIVPLRFVPILFSVLMITWALAEVGSARKAMTTFFMIGLRVPLYLVLTALLLALVWLVLGFLVLLFSMFGPAVLGFYLLPFSTVFTSDTVSKQITRAPHATSRPRSAGYHVLGTCLWLVDCSPELVQLVQFSHVVTCAHFKILMCPFICHVLRVRFALSLVGACPLPLEGPGTRRARNLTRFKLVLTTEPCKTCCWKAIQQRI